MDQILTSALWPLTLVILDSCWSAQHRELVKPVETSLELNHCAQWYVSCMCWWWIWSKPFLPWQRCVRIYPHWRMGWLCTAVTSLPDLWEQWPHTAATQGSGWWVWSTGLVKRVDSSVALHQLVKVRSWCSATLTMTRNTSACTHLCSKTHDLYMCVVIKLLDCQQISLCAKHLQL